MRMGPMMPPIGGLRKSTKKDETVEEAKKEIEEGEFARLFDAGIGADVGLFFCRGRRSATAAEEGWDDPDGRNASSWDHAVRSSA